VPGLPNNSGETAEVATAITKPNEELKATQRNLVRRQHAWTTAAGWIITVPLAALLAAGLYFAMTALGVKP